MLKLTSITDIFIQSTWSHSIRSPHMIDGSVVQLKVRISLSNSSTVALHSLCLCSSISSFNFPSSTSFLKSQGYNIHSGNRLTEH